MLHYTCLCVSESGAEFFDEVFLEVFEDAVLVELRLPLEGGRSAGAEHAVVQLGGALRVDTLQTLQNRRDSKLYRKRVATDMLSKRRRHPTF